MDKQVEASNIYREREIFSKAKLDSFSKSVAGIPSLKQLPELTIFCAGSYARLEASEYSDIDLFFLCNASHETVEDFRTNQLQLFGDLIRIGHDQGFPKFSNDCQYIQVVHTNDIVAQLGSSSDDHLNYFTIRMLLLLESKCIYDQKAYEEALALVVEPYFKDFPQHQKTFFPVFLINDICRFWKTLLLNYENKRRLPEGDNVAENKQRVKNYKLKYSRLTTCLATIVLLGTYHEAISRQQIIDIAQLTPNQRLKLACQRQPTIKPSIIQLLASYEEFLETTKQATEKIERMFDDKTVRTRLFESANSYGDTMYEVLLSVDQELSHTSEKSLLRYLVI